MASTVFCDIDLICRWKAICRYLAYAKIQEHFRYRDIQVLSISGFAKRESVEELESANNKIYQVNLFSVRNMTNEPEILLKASQHWLGYSKMLLTEETHDHKLKKASNFRSKIQRKTHHKAGIISTKSSKIWWRLVELAYVNLIGIIRSKLRHNPCTSRNKITKKSKAAICNSHL